MRSRDSRAALESLGGSDVIMPLHVVNEAEVEIQVPIVGELLDAALDQLNRQIGMASTLRRFLRQEDRTKFVGRLELWIELYGDIQERSQHLVLPAAGYAVITEILHGTGPVNVGQQAAVAE